MFYFNQIMSEFQLGCHNKGTTSNLVRYKLGCQNSPNLKLNGEHKC